MVKKALGLDLANLTDELRKKHKIKDKVKGVLITGVEPNSPAAEKHLQPGMVIAEVQQQPVGDRRRIAAAHRQAQEGRQEGGGAAGGVARRRPELRGAELAVDISPLAGNTSLRVPTAPLPRR